MNQKWRLTNLSLIAMLMSFSLNAQEGQVTVEQNKAIDKLIDYKKDIKSTKVYRIQVYQSVDPDKAQREKVNFLNTYADWPVEIVWNTPNYKVWVGNFVTRLEADRALMKIKETYMNAIVFQPKVED